MPTCVVIHGPNLNLLGTREPEIYGRDSLAEIDALIERTAARLGWTAETFQSNHEGEIVDRIQAARNADGLIINPGALSHYSLAVADALRAVEVPAVEVHLSNIHAREPWRAVSVTAAACIGVVSGLGAQGYLAALHHLAHRHRGIQNQTGQTTVERGND
jgi:3-dehydroquinate dehydratase-2